jgi:hypothetical protein
MELSPVTILKAAVKAVPAVRYSLGVAGLGATVAIVLGLLKDPKIAVFGVVITIALMFVLVVFSGALKDLPGKRWLVAMTAWTVTILLLA